MRNALIVKFFTFLLGIEKNFVVLIIDNITGNADVMYERNPELNGYT